MPIYDVLDSFIITFDEINAPYITSFRPTSSTVNHLRADENRL